MATIELSCQMPLGSAPLPVGQFGDIDKSGIEISKIVASAGASVRASRTFLAEATMPQDQAGALRAQKAQRFLADLNRLIRWYRVAATAPAVRELTLAQVGQILFAVQPSKESWGIIEARPDAVSSALSMVDIHRRLKAGFESGDEPPVDELFLADARQALAEGRFREAVLACWSVIDATFNQRFDELVKQKLAGEWDKALDFLTSLDFGLRHKMTLGLRLVSNRSLWSEPDEFWGKLDRSYKMRNKIIHEGAVASEEDAVLSLNVARRVISIMKQL